MRKKVDEIRVKRESKVINKNKGYLKKIKISLTM